MFFNNELQFTNKLCFTHKLSFANKLCFTNKLCLIINSYVVEDTPCLVLQTNKTYCDFWEISLLLVIRRQTGELKTKAKSLFLHSELANGELCVRMHFLILAFNYFISYYLIIHINYKVFRTYFVELVILNIYIYY